MKKITELVGDVRPDVGASPPSARRSWPSATVLVFSPLRPREYVERMAMIILEVDAERGEMYLSLDMKLIGNDLIAAGADPAIVKREVCALESAIRAEMWRRVLIPGGA
jgi:hypothetical protein